MMYESNEQIEAGTNSEWIIVNLCPCDNLAIPTSIDEPFWLLLVNKGPHNLDTSMIKMAMCGQKEMWWCVAFGIKNWLSKVDLTHFVMINLMPLCFHT